MISGIVRREDGNYKEKMNDVEIGKLCGKREFFISYGNIDWACLNRRLLQLNKKRTSALARDFSNALEEFCSSY